MGEHDGTGQHMANIAFEALKKLMPALYCPVAGH
jgi:hypothetical protein